MPGNFIVYEHVNKVNDKRYIGITSQTPSRRFRKGEGYRYCTLFYRAIQKYGWNNFEHNIIFENLSEYEAKEKEKELIALYRSNIPEYGYNLLSGGQHYFHSSLSNEKNRQSHLGKKIIYSKETKERVCLERRQRWENKTLEEKNEILRKMQEGRKKHPPVRNKSITTKIRCVEKNIVFESIADAEEWLGHSRNCFAIGKVLNGKRKTTGGYHWEYVDLPKKERLQNG